MQLSWLNSEGESASYVDSNKRGRLFLVSFLLAISIFVVRAKSLVDITDSWQLLVMSATYFLASYIGILWGLRFDVSRKSLLLIIPQSALFVSIQSLFVTIFFFRDFTRIYQFLFLFILLIYLLGTTYVSFLMSNVFNVASFKKVPLEQVARTTSYILTLISVYFISFISTSGQLRLLFIPLSIFILSFFTLFFHLFHSVSNLKELLKLAIAIAFPISTSAIALLFISNRFELISLIPTSIALGLIGTELNKESSPLKRNYILVRYIAIVVAVTGINIFFVLKG